MTVSPNEPFEIIYSLFEHQHLGYLFESFIVQLSPKGDLTYQYQNVSHKNIMEFASGVDEIDVELVKQMDQIQQDAILRKFNPKGLKAFDFFSKTFGSEKGDFKTRAAIEEHLDKYRARILANILTKRLFTMTNDGIPIGTEIRIQKEKTKVYFHFDRQADKTLYYPIVKCGENRVKIQFTNTTILNEKPAFLLSQGQLHHFEDYVDAKKLKPFLDKSNIVIDRKIESTYFRKFVGPLIAQFNVFAKGFEIRKEHLTSKPQLTLTEIAHKNVRELTLFDGDTTDVEEEGTDGKITFDLHFNYGKYEFRYDSMAAFAYVDVEQDGDDWIFHKVQRNLPHEKDIVSFLVERGLKISGGRKTLPKNEAFSWIQQNAAILEEKGIAIKQKEDSENEYFLGVSSIEVNIVENRDWFDIKTKVRFGDFEIAFVTLRELVLSNRREFRLPNGQIAVIPEEWFLRYHELFTLSNVNDDDELVLGKHHMVLVQNLEEDGLASTVIGRKLANLQRFEEIEEIEMPKAFKGTLRPYQKAGYNWLHFLRNFNLGGCLADDMGLGKTVTTLAFLQSIKETNDKHPTLLIMPTSLIYNWQKEAEKFTPKLKVLIHSGSNREKNTNHFQDYDLVLSSYGVIRIDIDIIKNFRFDYIILDESQAIKNPSSNISQAVRMLNSINRLILTGTPLENSTMDLWSQLTFVNPGLLGSQRYFKEKFQIPIEKQRNVEATQKLNARVKPFMLRRHKSQVATELPEKIEAVQYCDMSDEQEKMYEETKAHYRNKILEHIEQKGLKHSHLMVLQGLMKLRQIANNPLMIDEDFDGESGKDSDVIHKMNNIIESGSKVLIFSQFVKHLAILKGYLDLHEIPYSYLDGSTKDREKQVNNFQDDPEIKVFLISLKAGGVGLNLTAAEYVFLLDPWWNPAIEAQAVDRAHRIGQKKTVFTYKFISRNTVEEKILSLQKVKRRLFDDLVTTEETFMKSLEQKDLLALLD
ncbi:Superfamily II DNA or RNA helicase, SNF2 family [Spirosomataceae bacterium TFI 002]|nr:Superfamily II DNA or RNA helicase, SNF2 family [Spirosomataceae bacterium TFI 002]